MSENKEIVLDVKLTGIDEITDKALTLQEIIKSAKTLTNELTDLIEKLEINI